MKQTIKMLKTINIFIYYLANDYSCDINSKLYLRHNFDVAMFPAELPFGRFV